MVADLPKVTARFTPPDRKRKCYVAAVTVSVTQARRRKTGVVRRRRRLHSSLMVHLSFAGQTLHLLGDGAVYWPSRRALLVADLHLEKASWFAGFGQLLPPYDSVATLVDLQKLVDLVQPAEIWCLGDSFHDSAGCDRLPQAAQDLLCDMAASRRWVWITGNHDERLVDRCGGSVTTEAVVDRVVLRHRADPSDPRPEISGHFHPRLRVRVRGRLVSRRCFVTAPTKLVLPAFGALTGGLDATHPEIGRAIGHNAEALIPVADRVLRFRLAA